MKKTILTLFALSLAAATPHLVHGGFSTTSGQSKASDRLASESEKASDPIKEEKEHNQAEAKIRKGYFGEPMQPATVGPAS
jgi:hypothetical protein